MAETIGAYPAVFGVLFAVAVVLLGGAMVWVAESSPAAPWFQARGGIVAPFAGVPAVLFALIVAVMIQDIWQHHTRAESAVAREADAIRTMRTVAAGLGAAGAGEPGAEFERLAVAYAAAASAPDWRRPASREAGDALARRMLTQALFGPVAQANPAAQRVLLDATADIRSGRRERQEVGTPTTARLKWVGAAILGVFTLAAIALVHLGKPRTARLAVGLFGVCMAFVLWTALVRTDVFAGRYGVSLEAIGAAGR